MTISYNWISAYLPEKIDIEKLSRILTSIGLEVETITPYEEVKGGLEGLVIGEVITCIPHPDADKLKLTTVQTGGENLLQIVCGAPNVAVGQKVIVATIGATIYPFSGEPMTMKKAKIRGVESQGMICAEDEIGLNANHEGILILPENVLVGTKAADYFQINTDQIIEIGLTPNHMDAQSHLGVARDVVAYMNHHEKKEWVVKTPLGKPFKADSTEQPIKINVEDANACIRYAGVVLDQVTVGESPKWLQQKLKAVGLRPINNIVDITNFVLLETGQPLHAFDAAKIDGNTIHVKCLPAKTPFITLDEKERKLDGEDIMICNATGPMCMGGVFGGLESGVTAATTRIFLESAVFDPVYIRKTSLRHGLRTDAAIRFEKGVDISNTITVLKRAALLIKELTGAIIAGEVIDYYPDPKEKQSVSIKYHYLKKLSGKNYHPETIKNILQYLNFEIVKDGMDELTVLVPHHKTDISIPADLVEEIMRIDGLDNIEIPKTIAISPSVDTNIPVEKLKEKIAGTLVGMGLQEIFTNSITSSAFIGITEQTSMVKMMNNLSADLDILRTTMLETGLQSIAYNLNRKNSDLQFFEFGRTYSSTVIGTYKEEEHLAVYITGNKNNTGWQNGPVTVDIYFAKMIVEKILHTCGLSFSAINKEDTAMTNVLTYMVQNKPVASVGTIGQEVLQKFEIKQPVYHIDLQWDTIVASTMKKDIVFNEIPKFPHVERDLAIVVESSVAYQDIENTIKKTNIKKLAATQLFDVFENEKLGVNKKSLAVKFTFIDEEKTLTDKEVEGFLQKIINNLEKELAATLRK